MSFLLITAGAATSLYCLWQIRQWLAGAAAAAEAAPRRLEALAEELLTTAETTVAALEEKAEALNRAVAEADIRLARLGGGAFHAEPAPQPAPERVAQLAGAAGEVAASVASEPVPAPVAPSGGFLADRPEVHLTVYNLADAGYDVTTIARRLNMTKGEIQLILGLRQSR